MSNGFTVTGGRTGGTHPSNRLYRGEVEDAGDAMETLVAACDFEIRDFELFKAQVADGSMTAQSGLSAEEIQSDVDSDKAIALLVEYKRAAAYALGVYRRITYRYPDADEDEWCERTVKVLRYQIEAKTKRGVSRDYVNSLAAIADAFEAQDWQTLAI